MGASNQAPPTLCLLAQCVGLLALALALRPALLALAEKRLVDRLISAVSDRMMTVYIWHMTALMVGAGICVIALHINTPAPLSITWWLTAPLWLGLLAALLYPLVRVFGRLESIRMPRIPDAVGPVRATVATLLIAGGLLGIMLAGFTPTATPLLLAPIRSQRPPRSPSGWRCSVVRRPESQSRPDSPPPAVVHYGRPSVLSFCQQRLENLSSRTFRLGCRQNDRRLAGILVHPGLCGRTAGEEVEQWTANIGRWAIHGRNDDHHRGRRRLPGRTPAPKLDSDRLAIGWIG